MTQGLNLGLPHPRQMLYHVSHQGSLQKMSCNSVKFISLKAFHLLIMLTIKKCTLKVQSPKLGNAGDIIIQYPPKF